MVIVYPCRFAIYNNFATKVCCVIWDLLMKNHQLTIYCLANHRELQLVTSTSVATGVSLVNIRLFPFSTSENIRFLRYSLI